MWRLLKLGYRHEPGMILASGLLALVSAVPAALLALWIKWLGEGVLARDPRRALFPALLIGVTATLTWFLGVVYGRVQRRFRDRVTIALEAHVARLQATIPTIAHQERPAYLDRLSVLRDQIFVLDHMYMSLFSTAAWILRLGVAAGLLLSVHPALALLVLGAVPTVLSSSWRPGVEQATEEKVAASGRLARHLFVIATTAAPGKEVRVTGIGSRLVRERRAAWDRWYAPVARARAVSAAWHAVGWAVFGASYVGAVVFVATGLRAPTGDVLLVLAAGGQISFYLSATVGEIGFLRGIWLDGSRRLAWLEDYAAAQAAAADEPAPETLRDGLRFEGVSFAYPGTDRLVLDSVDLHLPAGSVVALVGENGAGKTTLVKLLARLYEPSSGAILVDGQPLARIRAHEWRARLAGAFQDFFRFELPARDSVGVGDVPRIGDERAVRAAVERAGAADVVDRLPRGLDTQLGPTWPEGVEMSFGQWQKLALARGFMRERPLLVVLDEPTAALDAETEHALFERYAAAARAASGPGGNGAVTLLVSHRFSTVRMADRIVVLGGARVAETGTHDELMARGGPYAQAYSIQAAAYR
ncbi:MAG: ABC transporter ATP-binding protein [Vicinamibacteria bacterium]